MTSINSTMPLPVAYVDHGIANNFGTYIEVNKHLQDYPHLLTPILKHEFSHTNETVSWHDFKLDFMMPQALHYREMFTFMIKHPKSFTQLLPFYWTRKKGFIYDINLMVMYLTMLIVFGTTIYFGGKYL